jgi:hypothetical protein
LEFTMLNITTNSSSQIHVGNLNFQLADGASGAPAALPADPPSWRQLHDDDLETETGWSS